jgi:hypothetical protein
MSVIAMRVIAMRVIAVRASRPAASATACASVGASKASTPRRTALGLPGRAATTTPRITPAVARDRMDRGPIWSQLRRRKASPKPSSVLSNSGSSVSIVVSRGAMPVPPVRITASALSPSQSCSSAARSGGPSSRRIACDTT